MKLVIPLLGFTKEDVSKESGFVNAYTIDDNKGSDNGFIYLMYDSLIMNIFTINAVNKLKKDKVLYSTYAYRIKNKVYTIYKIKPKTSQLENLLRGNVNLDLNSIARILQFWGLTDDYVNEILLKSGNRVFDNNLIHLPIADFQRPAFLDIGKDITIPKESTLASQNMDLIGSVVGCAV